MASQNLGTLHERGGISVFRSDSIMCFFRSVCRMMVSCEQVTKKL